MKKTFLFLASAAFLFAGCQKEALVENAGAEGEETVTIEVGLDETGTKAVADYDGNAVKANHWIMEVRDAQDKLFYRETRTPAEGTLTQTFTVSLIKNQSYNLLFWADNNGGYYNTEDLTNVSLTDPSTYAGNIDARDAFTTCKAITSTASCKISAKLYRPFAQVNMITTDLETIWAQAGTTGDQKATYAKFAPNGYVAKLSAPTSFNVLTQECGDVAPITITASESYFGYESDKQTALDTNNFDRHVNPATLFMDYIFATKSQKDIVDIDFEFTSNNEKISYNFTSVPLQANYRTNIKGKLLSNETEVVVEIIPTWNTPDYDVDVFETTIDNIEGLNEALKSSEAAASKEITATTTMPTDSDTKDVEFTSVNNDQVINLKFEGSLGSNKTITFKNANGANGPATLNIDAPAGTQLVFTNPQTHVVINGTSYDNISGTFSANSLIIAKGIYVKHLEIAAGGLEIHGTVDSVTVTGTAEKVLVRECEGLSESVYNSLKGYIATGYTGKENAGVWDIVLSDNWSSHAAKGYTAKDTQAKTLTIATPAQLALFRNELAADKFCYSGYTVTISSNLDMADYVWDPIPEISAVVIDGTNHTISNLTITADNAYGNAFISKAYACTIKNIIFDGANVSRKGEEFNGNIYAVVAAYAGYYTDATFEKVTVRNSVVSAYGKVGAIAGMAELQGNTLTFKDCKVENTTLKGCYNVGGLIGLFQYAVSSCRNQIIIENSTSSYEFVSAPIPDRNFSASTTIEGLTGSYLVFGSKFYAANALYYCEYGNPVAVQHNADALIHNTPDSIIITE